MDWNSVPGIAAIIGLLVQTWWFGRWSGRLETKVDTLWDIFKADGIRSGQQREHSPMDDKARGIIRKALQNIDPKTLSCLSEKGEAEVTMKLYRELGNEKLISVASYLNVTINGALYLIAQHCMEQHSKAITS